MIAPAAMDEERLSKDRKSEIRMRKEALRKASKSSLIKELANELEGRPEEVSKYNLQVYYEFIILLCYAAAYINLVNHSICYLDKGVRWN
jgi:hypothetical protein